VAVVVVVSQRDILLPVILSPLVSLATANEGSGKKMSDAGERKLPSDELEERERKAARLSVKVLELEEEAAMLLRRLRQLESENAQDCVNKCSRELSSSSDDNCSVSRYRFSDRVTIADVFSITAQGLGLDELELHSLIDDIVNLWAV